MPNGLTPAQYAKIRAEDAAKREKAYKEKIAKAGKFGDFAQWLKAGQKRTFAKLKYSDEDGKLYDGAVKK